MKTEKTHQVKGSNQRGWIDITEQELYYYEGRLHFEVRKKPDDNCVCDLNLVCSIHTDLSNQS